MDGQRKLTIPYPHYRHQNSNAVGSKFNEHFYRKAEQSKLRKRTGGKITHSFPPRRPARINNVLNSA